MLLYPAMKDLLNNIPSRYLLVNIVAARARKISSEAEQAGIPLEEKPVTMAINEVAGGMLRLDNAEMFQAESDESAAQSVVVAKEGQPEETIEE